VVFGVFWAAEGLEEAWPSAAILLGFIAIFTSAATAATRST